MKRKNLPIYRGTAVVVLLLLLSISLSFASSANWSYYGTTGPEYWGDLDPSYYLAKTGRSQSPINIETGTTVSGTSLPAISFNYYDSKVVWKNTGHALEAEVLNVNQQGIPTALNSMTIGTKKYYLKQFHVHTLSEHSVDEYFYDMEIHLVHKANDGELSVLGVFVSDGTENTVLAPLWNTLPASEEEPAVYPSQAIRIAGILPYDNKHVYRYTGSLTTPPCSEGVKWTVFAQPIQMSYSQINEFKQIFSGSHFPNGNRRPVQPLNGRTVYVKY